MKVALLLRAALVMTAIVARPALAEDDASRYGTGLNPTQVKMIMADVAEEFKSAQEALPQVRDSTIQVGTAAAPYLVPLLQHANYWTRWNAVDTLQALIRAGRLTPSWEKMVRDIFDEMHSNDASPDIREKVTALLDKS